MLVKLLTFLGGGSVGGKVAIVGIGIVAVAVGAYISYLNIAKINLENQIQDLEHKVATLELDVEREKGNVRECHARIDVTNQRIEDLKSVTDERTKIISMLGENIQLFKDASNARIQNIRNTVVGKSCEEAMQFLRDGVKDFKEN